MRRFLPLLIALAGCTAPVPHKVDDRPRLLTAEDRERDLKRNLREGRTWDEQEDLIKDVKGAFGQPSDADVLGPKTGAGPAK